jgi:hypothetical protein
MVYIFSNQKFKFVLTLEGLAMEDVGIFYVPTFGIVYGHLVYLMVIWSISSRFGKL